MKILKYFLLLLLFALLAFVLFKFNTFVSLEVNEIVNTKTIEFEDFDYKETALESISIENEMLESRLSKFGINFNSFIKDVLIKTIPYSNSSEYFSVFTKELDFIYQKDFLIKRESYYDLGELSGNIILSLPSSNNNWDISNTNLDFDDFVVYLQVYDNIKKRNIFEINSNDTGHYQITFKSGSKVLEIEYTIVK